VFVGLAGPTVVNEPVPQRLARERGAWFVQPMSSSASPRILRRERVYAGYMTVERLLLRLADGQEIWREVETHGDSVAVLPYDPVRRTALTVRLYRAPVLSIGGDEPLHEACAGMIDPDDASLEEAVRRETMEELGVLLGPLEFIACLWTSPGVIAERCNLFLAPFTAADRVAAGGGLASENENIEVIESELPWLAQEADRGAIADAKLFMLLQTLRLRRPDLFGP
jgi:nudix-type nucleoside diphosphatase (YffH/AdpP family)